MELDLPITSPIFVITPTYARATQKADLVSLCHTFMHVQRLVWIVIEDSLQKTQLVRDLLSRCQVQYVHLNVVTNRPKAGESVIHRGVRQRNTGLQGLREHYSIGNCSGVVYFGDDDNTYDLRLFEMVSVTVTPPPHFMTTSKQEFFGSMGAPQSWLMQAWNTFRRCVFPF